jgi:hypothetical protein
VPDLIAPLLQYGSGTPDRLMMFAETDEESCQFLAIEAVSHARLTMPRVSGATASRLQPIWGDGWFGIYFPDNHTWFMEHGTKPHTMRSLAGRTIPMWVSDTDGSIRSKDPKAKVRTTEDGRLQVLIFRRVAQIGQRKSVRRKNKVTGKIEVTSVPASYPGAPGRINRRVPGGFGPSGGQIAAGNGGVRWRHPGLRPMQFLNSAIAETAFGAGLFIGEVYATDGASLELLIEQQNRRVG